MLISGWQTVCVVRPDRDQRSVASSLLPLVRGCVFNPFRRNAARHEKLQTLRDARSRSVQHEIRASIEPDILVFIGIDGVEMRANSWATDHQLGCDGMLPAHLLTLDDTCQVPTSI